MPKKMTQDEAITKFREVHGDKYDFSRVVYKNASSPVDISCNKCGCSWSPIPSSLTSGHGCPRCAGREKYTTESFISASKLKHPSSKYSYDKVAYKNNRTNVILTCPFHGDFPTQPDGHLGKGYGCPKCSSQRNGELSRSSKEDFIEKVKKMGRSDDCSYDLVEYVGGHTPVEIVCKTHGSFWQAPSSHLSGQGCPTCSTIRRGLSRRLTKDEFVSRSEAVHNFKYSYSLVDAELPGISNSVKIVCPVHGVFSQTITDHMHSEAGCPKCASYGFKGNQSGKLYVLSCGEVTKIGITNLSVTKRAKDISKSARKTFKEVFSINFISGEVASDVETAMLRLLRSQYQTVHEVFDGYTECFIDVDINVLLSDIVETCSKHLPKYIEKETQWQQ